MPLPSEIPFVSFLRYSPRGTSPASKLSQAVMRGIKNDGALPSGARAIEFAARRLREELPNYPVLTPCFGPHTWLVPVPRSAPLVQGGLWPSRRLCDAIHKEGLVAGVLPAITRASAVVKSATAAAGQRPDPQKHYDSLAVAPNVNLLVGSLTIVDDVVTRGATFLACYARLRGVYPETPIHCFAMIRTMSGVEVDSVLDPVAGVISSKNGFLHREP